VNCPGYDPDLVELEVRRAASSRSQAAPLRVYGAAPRSACEYLDALLE